MSPALRTLLARIVAAALWCFFFALLTFPLLLISPWFAAITFALWIGYLVIVARMVRAHFAAARQRVDL